MLVREKGICPDSGKETPEVFFAFQVKDDKEMFLLQESIEKYGILNPLIVRPVPDSNTFSNSIISEFETK